MAACVSVVCFEYILYTTALILFSHMDTPTCAGADTFCSPEGRPGLTGGAIVVLSGNLGAVALGAALVALLFVLRRRIGRAS